MVHDTSNKNISKIKISVLCFLAYTYYLAQNSQLKWPACINEFECTLILRISA